MKNVEKRVSYHCCGRMDERAGLKGETAIHFAKNAIKNGKTAEQCKKSDEKKYLSSKSEGDKKAIAYNGYCFIVDIVSECVITMYALPEWFGKHKIYDGKTRIKDAKKYQRMNYCSPELMAY